MFLISQYLVREHLEEYVGGLDPQPRVSGDVLRGELEDHSGTLEGQSRTLVPHVVGPVTRLHALLKLILRGQTLVKVLFHRLMRPYLRM